MGHPSCDRSCVLTVSGPVAHSVTEAISARFDGHSTRAGDATVLVIEAVDQAAVRAAMIMLWDSGHDVMAMVITAAHLSGADFSDQAEIPRHGDRLLP